MEAGRRRPNGSHAFRHLLRSSVRANVACVRAVPDGSVYLQRLKTPTRHEQRSNTSTDILYFQSKLPLWMSYSYVVCTYVRWRAE